MNHLITNLEISKQINIAISKSYIYVRWYYFMTNTHQYRINENIKILETEKDNCNKQQLINLTNY